MTEPTESVHAIPITDQIEILPIENAIYLVGSLADPFALRRWNGAGWQKSSGWSGCSEPGTIRRLTEGPMLIPNREEPTRVGAVVEDFLTKEVYVRTSTGAWIGPDGKSRKWKDMSYPVVIHYGANR